MEKRRVPIAVIVLALCAILAGPVAAQCEGDVVTLASLTAGGGQLPLDVSLETRPDLSNPGARALALGGAFIASADDTTSVLANPAGLAAMNRFSVQLEGRSAPVVQYDRYGTGLVGGSSSSNFTQKDGATPVFASFVVPVGDRFVLGGFYQRAFSASRDVRRVTGANPATGPCFQTVNSRGIHSTAFLPLYDVQDDSSIDRYGASLGLRLSNRISVGATVYQASEDRSLRLQGGYATGPDLRTPGVETSDDAIGFTFGAQATLSEKLRMGVVWSSKVELDATNARYDEQYFNRNAFHGTVLPARAGLGLTWFPTDRWAILADGVWVQTSALERAVYLPGLWEGLKLDPFGAFEGSDSYEARLGVEVTASQSRTSSFTLRFGGWVESPSNLKWMPGAGVEPANGKQAFSDALSVIFPNEDDAMRKHATVGVGLVLRKRWQIDAGFDYEFERKVPVVSVLLGWTPQL